MNLGRMDPTLRTEEINYLSKVSFYCFFPPKKFCWSLGLTGQAVQLKYLTSLMVAMSSCVNGTVCKKGQFHTSSIKSSLLLYIK